MGCRLVAFVTAAGSPPPCAEPGKAYRHIALGDGRTLTVDVTEILYPVDAGFTLFGKPVVFVPDVGGPKDIKFGPGLPDSCFAPDPDGPHIVGEG